VNTNTPSESGAEIQAHAEAQTAGPSSNRPATTPEMFNVGTRYTPKNRRDAAAHNKPMRRIFRGLVERLHVQRFKSTPGGGKAKTSIGSFSTADNSIGQGLASVGRLRVLVGKFAKNSHARRRLLEAELEHRRAERRGEAKS